MPIYEFQCELCNHEFERLILPSDEKHPECPRCGSIQVKRNLSVSRLLGKCGGGFSASASSRFS